jgi:ribosomal-protein-serine acetyltransferase
MNLTLLPLPALLAGAAVQVRPWRRGDGDTLFALIEADRARLSRWLPWPRFHVGPEDSEAYVRRAAAEWALRSEMATALCLPDGTLVGGSGYHKPDWELRSFEIGYWVAAAFEGRGLVREAVALLTALAFERLEARRVFIRCEPQNARSSAVPARLGFVEEGTLRQAFRPPEGVSGDVRYYGMLREDYFDAPWAPDAADAVHRSDTDG